MSEINEYNQRIQIDTCWDCKNNKKKIWNERKFNEMKWKCEFLYEIKSIHKPRFTCYITLHYVVYISNALGNTDL